MGQEAALQTRCRTFAKRHGWWCAKFTSPGTSGVPDMIFIRNGKVVFVEFKAPGGKPTPLQKLTLETMAAHGATVAVCDSYDWFADNMA